VRVSEETVVTVRLIGFTAAMVLAFAWQMRSPHLGGPGSTRVNGALWLLNLLVTGTICGACVCGAASWAAQRSIGLLNLAAAPQWLALPLTVAFLDFVSYAWHRANHVVPLLWRYHQVHHSDPSFTVSTSLRFHPGELLMSLPVRLAAVLVVGAPVLAVVIFEVAFTFANAVEHGDIDVAESVERAFATVFVTPALHRRHHAIVAADRDRNFATIFSFWDRLFATYRASTSRDEVRAGLPGLGQVTLRDALWMPLRRPAA
jgi:sterol desaturase/sphingolipid hydroxylase (fatty acid hydroxylase superfamily)